MTENESIYTSLKGLCEDSLFRQAYELGIKELGPVKQWPTLKLKHLATQILGHLGAVRDSDALTFALWRKDPSLKTLAPDYIAAVHRRRGPLKALLELDSCTQKMIFDSKDAAYLAAERASIILRYRDFSTAEKILLEIPKEEQNRWLKLQSVEIKIEQDQYQEALLLLDNIIQEYPKYRAAIQKRARLLQLLSRTDEAIEVLQNFWEKTESWWLGTQLFALLLEGGRYKDAESCLNKLNIIRLDNCLETTHSYRSCLADLLCAQERYEEALEQLPKSSLFHSRVKQSIESSRDDSKRKVIDVPFVRQDFMTCAPASLTSVSQYWGRQENQHEIIAAICYDGTPSQKQRQWVNERGWNSKEFDLCFDTLKALIDLEIPVLLSTVEPGSAHLQIIVGYDESMGTYLIRDPYHPRLQEFLIEESQRYYASDGPRCMIFYPGELETKLNNISFLGEKLYDILFELNGALENHDRERACWAVEAAKQHDPKHRLTIMCERGLALYDRDEMAILASTEKLLELFPDDVNYQLSKVSSLTDIGATSKTLEYLESVANKSNSHFLLRSRLADQLRYDHREQERTEKLYQQLLSARPTSAETLYGYAGVLWDKEQYALSYQLYRFCACLEDMNESYVDSYFKAARFQKESDQAVEFLKDRYERFGSRSGGPVLSLFNALESLNRTEEAIHYLEHAIKQRPDDAWLLLFAARKYVYLGNAEKAKAFLEQAQPYSSVQQFNETAINVFQAQLKYDEVLTACRQLLELDPLSYNANETLVRTLTGSGRRDEAVEHLRKQLRRFAGNAMLQQLLIDWLDPAKLEDLLKETLEYIQYHPNDAWGFRALSDTYLNMQKYEEALKAAQEAVNINGSRSVNYGFLGDAYLALKENEKAHDAYKTAIERSCDYSYAYGKLLDISQDLESQKKDIEFIYQELMKQVSYGNGILEFQKVAKHYLTQEKLGEFVSLAFNERPDLWQSWVVKCTFLRETNDCDSALKVIDQAIRKFPLLPRFHLERGEVLRLLYREDEAIESFKYTLELSPGWIHVSNQLCEIYEERGQLEDAIALQELAIKHSPLSSSPYGYFADLSIKLGRLPEAEIALEKAIKRGNTYRFAWRTLYDLRKKRNAEESVFNWLNEFMDSWPDNDEYVEIYVDLSESYESAIQVMEKFLAVHPHNLDICLKLVRDLVNSGNIDEARKYISAEYWNGKRPVAVMANEAWIYAKKDNLSKAINLMEEVARENPNYYDAWRHLTIWYCEVKNKDEVERTVVECARLYPHESNVLCFCAEKLEEVEGDKTLVAQYLKHAFELDKTHQYNALTYIDYVLEQKDWQEAKRALDILQLHHQNPYVLMRRLQIHLALNEKSEALACFEESVRKPAADNSIVFSMWLSMAEQELKEPAAELIKKVLQEGRGIDAYAGKCLASYELENMKISKFESGLAKREFNDLFSHRYLEMYIRHLIKSKRKISASLETQLSAIIKQDSLNWGLYGYYLFAVLDQEYAAADFVKRLEKRSDAQAWALFFASKACRWANQWQQGERFIARAYELEPDNYRNDIIVWHILDQLLNNKPVDCSPLIHIHLDDDMQAISNYALAAARVLEVLRTTNFANGYDDISPLLRVCQRRMQECVGHAVVEKTRMKLRKKLKESISGMSFFNKMWWSWKLSNHF